MRCVAGDTDLFYRVHTEEVGITSYAPHLRWITYNTVIYMYYVPRWSLSEVDRT